MRRQKEEEGRDTYLSEEKKVPQRKGSFLPGRDVSLRESFPLGEVSVDRYAEERHSSR
jgi:hypothetical protein